MALSQEELRARRKQLVHIWTRVVAEGAAEPVPGDLLASWRRSSAWVSPDVSAAPVDADGQAVAGWRTSPAASGLRAVGRRPPDR